jgi:spermidine synthase
MATASDETDPLALSEAEVERRLEDRRLRDLKFYNGATHRGVFAMPNFVREILARPLKPISAATPLDEDNIDPSHHLHLKMVREE